jgi:hypothetical protein
LAGTHFRSAPSGVTVLLEFTVDDAGREEASPPQRRAPHSLLIRETAKLKQDDKTAID